jgi:hypothetical protein
MISVLNIFIYLSQSPLYAISSYSSLLRIDFDAIFGDLLLLKCFFSLNMFVFILTWLFSLCDSFGCGMWVLKLSLALSRDKRIQIEGLFLRSIFHAPRTTHHSSLITVQAAPQIPGGDSTIRFPHLS